MADKVDIREAETGFLRLLTRIERGEEIVLVESGRPVARLVPVSAAAGPRVPGSAKGRMTIAEDFDAPLPGNLLDAFE